MKTVIQLEGAGACREGIEFARQYPTLKGAWDACDRPEWLLWYVGRCPGTAERSAQFAQECFDRVKGLPEAAAKETAAAAMAAAAAATRAATQGVAWVQAWVATRAAMRAWAEAAAAVAAEAVETAAAERAWVCGRIRELFADLWAEGGVL